MNYKNFLATLAVTFAGLMAFGSTTANAYILTGDPDCGVVGVFDPDYDMCVGAYENETGGPDGESAQPVQGDGTGTALMILNDDEVFGAEDWTFLEKDEEDARGDCVSASGFGTSGTLTICDFGQDWPIEIAVVFKGATSYSLYYWEALAGPPGTIDWVMDGVATNNNGGVQGLSNVSVFYRDTGLRVAEPATLGLLGLGLVAVGFARRRNRA